MNHLSARIVFSFCLCAASSVWGQVTTLPACLPEDQLPELKALLNQAVSQAPTSLYNSLEVARSQAQKLVDASGMWPTLSANVSFTGVQSSIVGASDSKSSNSGFFYSLSVYQPLYHFGARKAQADIGELTVRLAERRYEEGYRQLTLMIRAQYLELIQKKKAANYSKESVRDLEGQVKALEQRLAAGAISPADLNEPRLKLAEARIASERFDEAFDLARRTLAALSGVADIPYDSVPDEYPKPQLTEQDVDQVIAAGAKFNPLDTPQGQIFSENIKQTDLQYKVARSRTLPNVNLMLSATESNSTDATNGRISSYNVSQQMAGVSANWQIFDGFATRGTKLALKQQRRQQEALLGDFDRAQREKVESLRRQISLAVRTLEIAETRFNIARGSVKAIADEVKSGHSSEEGLKMVTQAARNSELTTLAARAELFARVSEYLSVVGADPAVASLKYRNTANGQ